MTRAGQLDGTEVTADVELKVGILNNGTTDIPDSFRVTFYADAAMTQVIGDTIVAPRSSGIINGCSWGRITDWASVTWSGLPVGTTPYWVKVDSHNDIPYETSEIDNVTSGLAIVAP